MYQQSTTPPPQKKKKKKRKNKNSHVSGPFNVPSDAAVSHAGPATAEVALANLRGRGGSVIGKIGVDPVVARFPLKGLL